MYGGGSWSLDASSGQFSYPIYIYIFFFNLLEPAYQGDKITLGTFSEIAPKSKYLSWKRRTLKTKCQLHQEALLLDGWAGISLLSSPGFLQDFPAQHRKLASTPSQIQVHLGNACPLVGNAFQPHWTKSISQFLCRQLGLCNKFKELGLQNLPLFSPPGTQLTLRLPLPKRRLQWRCCILTYQSPIKNWKKKYVFLSMA